MIKGPTEILYDIAASYLKEKLMKVSNCCGVPFYEPGWPDNDICSNCKEHANESKYEYPRSSNLIKQMADREKYKHGWNKEMTEHEEEAGHKPLMTLGCEEIVHGPNDPGDENDNIIMTESDEADKRAINKVIREL